MVDDSESWVFPVLDEEKYHAESLTDRKEQVKIQSGTRTEQASASSFEEKEQDSEIHEKWGELTHSGRLVIEIVLVLICSFIYINIMMNRVFDSLYKVHQDVQIVKEYIQKKSHDHVFHNQVNELIIVQSVTNLLHKNLCHRSFVTRTMDDSFIDLVPYMVENFLNNTVFLYGPLKKKVHIAVEKFYESGLVGFKYSVEFVKSLGSINRMNATGIMTHVSLMFTNTISSLKSFFTNAIGALSR